MTDSPTDEALIAGARRGSARDFGLIVERHQGAVRSFLRRLSGSYADADDLAQETFVAAWSQLGRYRGEASVRTWLCSIAYRKALSEARSSGRRQVREAGAADPEPGSPPSDGLRLDLVRAMQTLAVDERAAVALCLGGGFSHAEAAEALARPWARSSRMCCVDGLSSSRSWELEMVESHDSLATLFAESAAPPADPVFTLTVIAELERREAVRQFAWRMAYAALAGVLIWAGRPALELIAAGLAEISTPALIAAVAAGLIVAAFVMARRLGLGDRAMAELVGMAAFLRP